MSVSPTQLAEFSKLINNHDALSTIRERIELKLFKKFKSASPQEREVINNIIDNADLFYAELKSIDAESSQIEQDEIIPINQEVK